MMLQSPSPFTILAFRVMGNRNEIDRRDFLRAGLTVSASALAPFWSVETLVGRQRSAWLIVDPSDSIATAAPSRWAVGELHAALADAGLSVRQVERVDQASANDL